MERGLKPFTSALEATGDISSKETPISASQRPAHCFVASIVGIVESTHNVAGLLLTSLS